MTSTRRGKYYTFTNDPYKDWLKSLWSMGEPWEDKACDGDHECEEIPLCRNRAVRVLKFWSEDVYLCQKAYKRYKEKK